MIDIPPHVKSNNKLTDEEKLKVSKLMKERDKLVEKINHNNLTNETERNPRKKGMRKLFVDILIRKHAEVNDSINEILFPNSTCLCTLHESCELCG